MKEIILSIVGGLTLGMALVFTLIFISNIHSAKIDNVTIQMSTPHLQNKVNVEGFEERSNPCDELDKIFDERGLTIPKNVIQ